MIWRRGDSWAFIRCENRSQTAGWWDSIFQRFSIIFVRHFRMGATWEVFYETVGVKNLLKIDIFKVFHRRKWRYRSLSDAIRAPFVAEIHENTTFWQGFQLWCHGVTVILCRENVLLIIRNRSVSILDSASAREIFSQHFNARKTTFWWGRVYSISRSQR